MPMAFAEINSVGMADIVIWNLFRGYYIKWNLFRGYYIKWNLFHGYYIK